MDGEVNQFSKTDYKILNNKIPLIDPAGNL